MRPSSSAPRGSGAVRWAAAMRRSAVPSTRGRASTSLLPRIVARVGTVGASLLMLSCGGLTGPGTQRLDQILTSPDGRTQAVIYTSKGGPAAGGWCGRRLALRAATDSAPDLVEFDRTAEYSFYAGCSSTVQAEWRSPTDLHVIYTMPNQGVTVHEEPLSLDGKVHLSYEYR
jgi:hypothetical protein